MKRFLTILSAFALLVSLQACSKREEPASRYQTVPESSQETSTVSTQRNIPITEYYMGRGTYCFIAVGGSMSCVRN